MVRRYEELSSDMIGADLDEVFTGAPLAQAGKSEDDDFGDLYISEAVTAKSHVQQPRPEPVQAVPVAHSSPREPNYDARDTDMVRGLSEVLSGPKPTRRLDTTTFGGPAFQNSKLVVTVPGVVIKDEPAREPDAMVDPTETIDTEPDADKSSVYKQYGGVRSLDEQARDEQLVDEEIEPDNNQGDDVVIEAPTPVHVYEEVLTQVEKDMSRMGDERPSAVDPSDKKNTAYRGMRDIGPAPEIERPADPERPEPLADVELQDEPGFFKAPFRNGKIHKANLEAQKAHSAAKTKQEMDYEDLLRENDAAWQAEQRAAEARYAFAQQTVEQEYDDYAAAYDETQRQIGFSHEPIADVKAFRQQAVDGVIEQATELIPSIILASPAAKFIIDEVAVLAGSNMVAVTEGSQTAPGLIHQIDSRQTTRFEKNHDLTVALGEAVDDAKEFAMNRIFLDVDPLEAARRTMAVLSQSKHPAAEIPIEVVTNSRNNVLEIDAWQASHIVDAESVPGGSILARIDHEGVLERPTGERDITLRAAVGLVQDLEDEHMTLAFSLSHGSLPMPDKLDSDAVEIDGAQDWGTLRLQAVALDAGRFDKKMINRLNAPQEIDDEDEIGNGGYTEVKSTRRYVKLVHAFGRIADSQDIGLIAELDDQTRLELTTGN